MMCTSMCTQVELNSQRLLASIGYKCIATAFCEIYNMATGFYKQQIFHVNVGVPESMQTLQSDDFLQDDTF